VVTYIVYGLYDPVSNNLRYIGQTTRGLEARLSSHQAPSNLKRNTHCARWLSKLRKADLRPTARILDASASSQEELDVLETQWIERERAGGARLVNMCVGGRGGPKRVGFKHSEETKAKIAAAQTGHTLSAHSRAKMSAKKRGRPSKRKGVRHTPQHIEANRLGHIGIRPSLETRAKQSLARKGLAAGPKHPQFKTTVSTEDILARLSRGQSRTQIALDLGICVRLVGKRVEQSRRAGLLPPSERGTYGAKVLELRRSGLPYARIASLLAISKSRVAQLCREESS
jgi:DNA-binding NarL/FixJ family response regulator